MCVCRSKRRDTSRHEQTTSSPNSQHSKIRNSHAVKIKSTKRGSAVLKIKIKQHTLRRSDLPSPLFPNRGFCRASPSSPSIGMAGPASARPKESLP